MTRINSAIPVQCLTDEHLLAEHREIKRLPFNLRQSIKSGSINRIPEKFTLGKGHVLFFLNKMDFIKKRYKDLHEECKLRGMNVSDYTENWAQIPRCHFGGHLPSSKEHEILVERITERIRTSPKKSWHYCGKEIDKEIAVKMLTRESLWEEKKK